MRICLSLLVVALPLAAADQPVDSPATSGPILANSCFACHGPDEKARKAKLRLDVRDEAVKKAIVPGKPAESQLIERVTSKDPDEVMPPAARQEAGRHPGAGRALLKRWIDEGAKYDQHWAYVKPVRPAIPDVDEQGLGPQPGRLRSSRQAPSGDGLRPGPGGRPGDAHPPAVVRPDSACRRRPAEVDAFVKDTSADAYEKVVDRLLGVASTTASGWPSCWLDLVRYADTRRLPQRQPPRRLAVPRLRDRRVQQEHAVRPVHRRAARRRPAARTRPTSRRSRPATTGCCMTTEEGGAQPKEYPAKYAADRVRNASTVWLGATHGLLPSATTTSSTRSRTQDFYRFAAFFADVHEVAVGRQPETPSCDRPGGGAEEARRRGRPAQGRGREGRDRGRRPGEVGGGGAKNSKGLPKPVTDASRSRPASGPTPRRTRWRHITATTSPRRRRRSARSWRPRRPSAMPTRSQCRRRWCR